MKFNIYAGLGGGFGGAEYRYTADFADEHEALEEAYNEACEIYYSYEGGDDAFLGRTVPINILKMKTLILMKFPTMIAPK